MVYKSFILSAIVWGVVMLNARWGYLSASATSSQEVGTNYFKVCCASLLVCVVSVSLVQQDFEIINKATPLS